MNFLFLIVLILLMLCGVPVAYSIGIATLIGMAAHSGIQWGTLASSSLSGINSFTFLAIPLFLLAGKLMNTGGITRRLFRFAKDLVGWLPGGLGSCKCHLQCDLCRNVRQRGGRRRRPWGH